MRIERNHSQNGGGILNPNIRFPERLCSCPICDRPSRLHEFLETLRRGLSALAGRRQRTTFVVVRKPIGELTRSLDQPSMG